MRLETNEAWIISKVFGEIDIFIYSPSFDPEAFHLIKSDIPKIKNEENNYTNKKDIKYS